MDSARSSILRPADARPALTDLRQTLVFAALAAAGALVIGVAVARGGSLSWIAVAVAVGLVVLPLFADYPYQALVAWIAVAGPAFPFLRIAPYVTFDRVWLGAMAVSLFVRERVLPQARATRLMTLALLWLAAAFGVRAATTDLGGMQIWVDAVLLPLVLFLVVDRYVTTLAHCRVVAGALAAAGALVGTIGIAAQAAGFELASRSGGELRESFETSGQYVIRPSGPYAVPEVYAVVLIVCLAATLFWTLHWFRLRVQRKVLLGVSAATIEAAAIGLSLFRAAWIAAIIVVIAAFGLRPRRYGRLLAVAGAVAALGIAGTVELRDNTTFQTRVENTDNVSGRLATYVQGFEIFKSKPLAGVGVDQYPYVAPTVRATYVDGVKAVEFPHSSYVGALAEQGLLGFVPLLAVTFGAGYLLRAYARRARAPGDILLAAAATGAALGYLLMSITLMMLPYGPSNAFLLLLLGLVAARLNALEHETREGEPAHA
ncbi:MAG: O-antigen ligase family protein [Actinomycetota bacterium]|nr:O-antigen ligase family protein [Actinomycetota bacterium]